MGFGAALREPPPRRLRRNPISKTMITTATSSGRTAVRVIGGPLGLELLVSISDEDVEVVTGASAV